MLDLFSMSKTELDRAAVLERVLAKRLSLRKAATELGLSERQTSRLLKIYMSLGAPGLISRKRGKRSNRAYPAALKRQVLGFIRAHYSDFGPTLACEKLEERHGIHISKETVRLWMIEDGLWIQGFKLKRVQQPRQRRDCFGELIQIDGSHHRWFEDRGPKCALLVFIDDATGRLMDLHFCESENTFDYMIATQRYINQYGKPLAFYSDKHSIFRSQHVNNAGADNTTQFGRALHELNIDIICANTPQAKGRVERANGTLQDRLVKELRLAGIDNIDHANDFVDEYMAHHNAKFMVEPRFPINAHRPVESHEDLDQIFCQKYQRVVSHQLVVQYDKVQFHLEESDLSRRLAGRQITVCDYPDGRLLLKHRGLALPYTRFDKLQRVGRPELIENKRLGAALDMIRSKQEQRRKEGQDQRSQNSPSRKGQRSHSFPEQSAPTTEKKPGRRTKGAKGDWTYHIPGKTRPKPSATDLKKDPPFYRKVSTNQTVVHKGLRYRINPETDINLQGEILCLYELRPYWIEIEHEGALLPYKYKRQYQLQSLDDGRSEVRSRSGPGRGEPPPRLSQ